MDAELGVDERVQRVAAVDVGAVAGLERIPSCVLRVELGERPVDAFERLLGAFESVGGQHSVRVHTADAFAQPPRSDRRELLLGRRRSSSHVGAPLLQRGASSMVGSGGDSGEQPVEASSFGQ